jgi:hypothetical protein
MVADLRIHAMDDRGHGNRGNSCFWSVDVLICEWFGDLLICED